MGLQASADYSFAGSTVSDLGNTACRQVRGDVLCSPWHAGMDVAFVWFGCTLIVGAVLLGTRVLPGRSGIAAVVAWCVSGLGSIGVGLFLGSGKAIHNAGPGLLLGYAVGGLAIFFIMRALGELMAYRPVAGSFARYASEFVGPFAGFVTGWSYWFMWVVTAMAELTAIGIYMHYWFPHLPQWIPTLVALVIVT